MDSELSPQHDEVAEVIARCAEVVGDLDRLRDELHALRVMSDQRAMFACALFDLERARRGDPEARATMLEVADSLLVFWREGTGVELARMHPAVEELWASAATLLVSFEVQRFHGALQACWENRREPAALRLALERLEPDGNRRVEFARCLYALELARLGDAPARAQFSSRAGLLAEAYQSEAVASELVGDDAGLQSLWSDVRPFLDEFFEELEERARKRRRGARTEPNIKPATVSPEPTAEPRDIPTFRNLVGEAAAPPPPPPPKDLTPPGGWPRPPGVLEDVLVEGLEEELGGAHPVPTGELELVDAEELPAAPPPAPSADVPLDDDYTPDEATLQFWQHTLQTLSLLPDSVEPRVAQRLLAADSRAERKKLGDYLESIEASLQVPEARAFSCLVRLMLGAQLKEKGLFGQPNPRRTESFLGAFSLLSADSRAAGHAAVWFALDGAQTEAALQKGLEVLLQFLAYCARAQLNPLAPASQQAFLAEGTLA